MIIYLLCIRTRSHFSMPSEILEGSVKEGTIYKANTETHGGYAWNDSTLWGKGLFEEISQAKAFVLTKGNIDLVEELF